MLFGQMIMEQSTFTTLRPLCIYYFLVYTRICICVHVVYISTNIILIIILYCSVEPYMYGIHH